jgi:hypothetical protein
MVGHGSTEKVGLSSILVLDALTALRLQRPATFCELYPASKASDHLGPSIAHPVTSGVCVGEAHTLSPGRSCWLGQDQGARLDATSVMTTPPPRRIQPSCLKGGQGIATQLETHLKAPPAV